MRMTVQVAVQRIGQAVHTFKLKCGMGNIVAMKYDLVDAALDLRPRADMQIICEDMRRHGAQILRKTPNMQVMNAKYAHNLHHILDQFARIDIAWCGFEQNIHGVAQDAPCIIKDEETDQHAHKRIKPVGICEINNDTRDDCTDRGKYITHEVNKRGADVEIVHASFADEQSGYKVNGHSDQPDHDQYPGLHFGRICEATPSFIKNAKRDNDQRS